MNSSLAKFTLESLAPTVNFQPGDIDRLPLFPIADADKIFATLEAAFSVHESHREASVEYQGPGPSPWRHAQEWAQVAVDRAEGVPLAPYVEEMDNEPATDHVSWAVGVVLGRHAIPSPPGRRWPVAGRMRAVPETKTMPGTGENASPHPPFGDPLPGGEGDFDGDGGRISGSVLFLDLSNESQQLPELLEKTWGRYGAEIAPKRSLKEYLALDFFKEVHRTMYENRPIHWPLSSANRTFVVWVNIHGWKEQTLRIVLADHLVPRLAQIEGELADLRAARDGADKKAAREAEKVYEKRMKAREELVAFIADVERCADKGPEPTDGKCPKTEVEARYAPVLDDGVMINSAALWKLLEPQWKDPKKWWKELASAEGKKDYDWAQLARRYFPKRVEDKCKKDPSLGVAHGCFWKYHPARAWAWELRLQAEIGPEFRIEEEGAAAARAAYLETEEAIAAIEKEALRRGGRGKERTVVAEMRILEGGLWRRYPEKMWAMEWRVAEKQGGDFVLRAPDEDARNAWMAAHPEQVEDRQMRVAQLRPAVGLYEEAEESGGDPIAEAD